MSHDGGHVSQQRRKPPSSVDHTSSSHCPGPDDGSSPQFTTGTAKDYPGQPSHTDQPGKNVVTPDHHRPLPVANVRPASGFAGHQLWVNRSALLFLGPGTAGASRVNRGRTYSAACRP